MKCPACGKPVMEAVQRFEVLGYEFPIYTCWSKGCEKFGFTYSGAKRPVQPKVAPAFEKVVA